MELVRQNEKLSGMERIRLERLRQVETEGYTPSSDDNYKRSELRKAAGCYELAALNNDDSPTPPRQWPWSADKWKPKGILRNLERAGALYQADIDRLERQKDPLKQAVIDLMEQRIATIANEIDKFIAPLPGENDLYANVNYNSIQQMNTENNSSIKLLETSRKMLPLIFEDDLRKKLAAPTESVLAPSGSMLNKLEVCACESGVMCEHRLDWLVGYLQRAFSSHNLRLQESAEAVDSLSITIDELKDEVRELKIDDSEE
jgi:hypothetical protein